MQVDTIKTKWCMWVEIVRHFHLDGVHACVWAQMLGSAFHEFQHEGGLSRIRVDVRLCLRCCLAACWACSSSMTFVTRVPQTILEEGSHGSLLFVVRWCLVRLTMCGVIAHLVLGTRRLRFSKCVTGKLFLNMLSLQCRDLRVRHAPNDCAAGRSFRFQIETFFKI